VPLPLPQPIDDLIPEPGTVHARLAETVRAERLLRRLLKVSIAAQQERARRLAAQEEAAHA
jgi:hypothetical protein